MRISDLVILVMFHNIATSSEGYVPCNVNAVYFAKRWASP
jgi:hypothetical protein